MTNVKYLGPWGDYSGYGEANRNYIAALYLAGVNLTTERVVYVPEQTELGWTGKLAFDLEHRNIDYKIKIIHLTPENYAKYLEPGKYHIGHLFWETDRVPQEWIDYCNLLDEFWTASPNQARIFKKSGIKVPIYSFPQTFDVRKYEGVKPFEVPQKSGFLFYSIFQWTERKNPRGLLTAYWKAFEGNNDVTLLLKVYRSSFSVDEYERIKQDILKWKSELSLSHYPKVLLYGNLMTSQDVLRLHATGDCFVSAHKGEGWGLPQMEAIATETPIISTNYGGIHDYLTTKEAYLIPYDLETVHDMGWIPWYTPDQRWANPREKDLIEMFRDVYNNPEVAKEKGRLARQLAVKEFSFETVGQRMKERLEEVERHL